MTALLALESDSTDSSSHSGSSSGSDSDSSSDSSTDSEEEDEDIIVVVLMDVASMMEEGPIERPFYMRRGRAIDQLTESEEWTT